MPKNDKFITSPLTNEIWGALKYIYKDILRYTFYQLRSSSIPASMQGRIYFQTYDTSYIYHTAERMYHTNVSHLYKARVDNKDEYLHWRETSQCFFFFFFPPQIFASIWNISTECSWVESKLSLGQMIFRPMRTTTLLDTSAMLLQMGRITK